MAISALLAWLDNTSEVLAGMLRPGNAGSNTAADIRITDEAIAQIPDADRHGGPILVRSDGALGHQAVAEPPPRSARPEGLDVSFSIGFTVTNQVKDAIEVLPEAAWTVAVHAAGEPRRLDESGLPVASVAELTELLPAQVGGPKWT